MKAPTNPPNHPEHNGETAIFYSDVLRILNQASIPVLVGGGYGLEFYTRRGRQIKDLDLFMARPDLPGAFTVLQQNNFRTTLDFPHWLGKVCCADEFIDLIFSSGNGLCEVDSLWFKYSRPGTLYGLPIRYCPPEEMIWSKAFVMERERYDGGDVSHMLLACGQDLDWERLLFRFSDHWRVLHSHIVLFDYIYPSEKRCVPQEIRSELISRLQDEMNSPAGAEKHCRGPLLSRSQYQVDTLRLGYQDGRVAPAGKLSSEEAASWTAAGNHAGSEKHGSEAKKVAPIRKAPKEASGEGPC